MKTKIKHILPALFMGLSLALSACGDKTAETPAKTDAPNLTQTPDVGQVEQVTTTAKGSGISPGAALNDALKMAIMQVNGTAVQASSTNVNRFAEITATLDVDSTVGSGSADMKATMQSHAFAEQIISQSKGVVSSFKVLDASAPFSKGGIYKVEIEARIAKFKAPADSDKIKIVVAPLRSAQSSFDIGGRAVPAQEMLAAIRQQIIDALSQTGRFTVLDREFAGELQDELNLITSGQSPNSDLAKLGQALSADLVWVGVVNELAYKRNARKLQTSDRELVSYAGAWSVSQRMINLATRQILQSTTLRGEPPTIAPTTLGANFNESQLLKNMQAEIVKQATEAILLRTFPISIVERDGDSVVLSQGGSAVAQNGRYRVYLQGKEIKDPQTGQSLGNMEKLCCEVRIERVTPNLSYGVLENVNIKLDGVAAGALQIREAAVVEKAAMKTEPEAAPVKSEGKRSAVAVEARPAARSNADDKDW